VQTKNTDTRSAVTKPGLHFVLLYTTAEEFRPTYRRGILDALAYPEGHTIEYSYRVKNISPAILEAVADKALQSVPGVIVFVDVASTQTSTSETVTYYPPPQTPPPSPANYYPLRRVTITAVDGIVGLQARERIRLRLTLADFIAYQPNLPPTQLHPQIAVFDEARGFQGEKPSYFVIPATDTFGTVNVEDRTAWEDVVTEVSQSRQLRDCVFLRVPPLQRLGKSKIGKSRTMVCPVPSDDSVEYVLKPWSVYRMELSVFEPHSKDGRQTKIAVKSSSDEILQVGEPFQSMVAGTAEWALHLATRRDLERNTATITVEVTGSSQATVTTPNPVLFVRIPVGRRLVISFLFLVLGGVFLVSLDKDVVAEASLLFQTFKTDYPELITFVAKILGSILLSWAAWLGFRKLPSAIKG